MACAVNSDDEGKNTKQQPGYQTRDIIIDYWCYICAGISFINSDIKFLIQLYSYPIPFNELRDLLSYKILIKQNSDKVYQFEKIDDMFCYKVSNPNNINDIIYHPLQPIIPNILTAKSTSFSHIGKSKVSFTKLRLVLRPTFAEEHQTYVQYKYNGKNKEEMPEIWRCVNGKQIHNVDIIGYNRIYSSVEFKMNSDQTYTKNDYVLSLYDFDKFSKYLENGVKLNDIKLEVYTAPLRLPNEKHICVVSVVDDIIALNDDYIYV
eukprot:246283_1